MIVRINAREITVPESWNDLSLEQLCAAYAILLSDAPAWIEPVEVLWFKRLELAKYFLRLSDDEISAWRNDCIQYAEDPEEGHALFLAELDALLAHFNQLIEAVEHEDTAGTSYQVKLGLTKCPYSIIQDAPEQQEYHAPANELENLTIYELGQAFTLFERYLETQQEHYVDQLIATLYRPAKPATESNKASNYQGDIRLPLSGHESTIPARAARMATLAPLAKQLILFWVASCRQAIVQAWPNLFEGEDSDIPGKKVGNDYGWGGIIMALANDITQIDDVAGKPYVNVFTYLSFLDDRRKLEEMRMKSARNNIVERAV